MAKSSKLRVMISSRCETEIEFNKKPQKLTEVRRALKRELEDFKLPGQRKGLFECWINEDGTGGAGSQNWWDHCIKQAKDADFVFVLYTGSAGGRLTGSDMGICHAELQAAMDVAADRIRVIKLPPAPDSTDPLQKKSDNSFREYFKSLEHFTNGISAKTGEEVLEKAWNETQAVLVDLVQLGSSTLHLSQASTGHALEWHRLNYEDRKTAMEKEMTDSLSSRPNSAMSASGVLVGIDASQVLLRVHAAPASLSEPTAREMVGQPFLVDHKLHAELNKSIAGPIHLIACPKGVTEKQALAMLGFPDATIVADSFGIHIADNIQNIQIVLLKECVSPSAIRRQLAAWFEFLSRTGEDKLVARRARHRANIVRAIAACQEDNSQTTVGAVTAKAQAKKRASKGGGR